MTDKKTKPDTRADELPESYQWENRIPPNMTQDEYERHMVDKGAAARRILADPSFNFLYQELVTDHVNKIIDSRPDESGTRDDAYYEIRGLQDLMIKMKGWMATAELMSMRHEDPRNSIA